MSEGDPSIPIPVSIVLALGLTQIIGYGTLFYSYSVLAPAIARDMDVTVEQVFGIFSAALFVGGLSAPVIGRQIDRIGAATVLAVGSVLSALTLATCAGAPSFVVFAVTLVLVEMASGMVQYQAAFAVLVEWDPLASPRGMNHLTLIGAGASAIFWPLSAALMEYLTWRGVYLAFAALNLVVCTPTHLWLVRKCMARVPSSRLAKANVVGAIPLVWRRAAMIAVSGAFAALAFVSGAILSHIVPMLSDLGFGQAAYVASILFGVSQVLSRLFNMFLGSRLSPPALASVSAALMMIGTIIPGMSGHWLPGAVAFAICLGLGSGINSITQGSVPLFLFGSDGYGAVTGKMTAARVTLGATAPFVFALARKEWGAQTSLLAVAALGAGGMVVFASVAVAIRGNSPATH